MSEEESHCSAGSKKGETVKFRKELGRKGGVGSLIPPGAGSNLGVSRREEPCLLTQEVIAAPVVRESGGRGVRVRVPGEGGEERKRGVVPHDTPEERGERTYRGRLRPLVDVFAP